MSPDAQVRFFRARARILRHVAGELHVEHAFKSILREMADEHDAEASRIQAKLWLDEWLKGSPE